MPALKIKANRATDTSSYFVAKHHCPATEATVKTYAAWSEFLGRTLMLAWFRMHIHNNLLALIVMDCWPGLCRIQP